MLISYQVLHEIKYLDDEGVTSSAQHISDILCCEAAQAACANRFFHWAVEFPEVCGPGCINETFRVLKDNEMRQLGEYRTKRLVLEAWNNFGFGN